LEWKGGKKKRGVWVQKVEPAAASGFAKGFKQK